MKKSRKRKPMTRSENMSRVKNKDTKPEVYLRTKLWHEGFRYRKNYTKLPGKPDLYSKKYNIAIFINGCFWHMHKDCKAATIPASNKAFWTEKLNKNRTRDLEHYKLLTDEGIKTLVVWECTLKRVKKDHLAEKELVDTILAFIQDTEKGKFLEL